MKKIIGLLAGTVVLGSVFFITHVVRADFTVSSFYNTATTNYNTSAAGNLPGVPNTGSIPLAPTVVTALNNASGPSSAATYQLYPGFLAILGQRLAGLTNTSSLGDFLNAIIALVTAIGGVLAIVMIMYEGYSYMVARRDGEVVKMEGTRQNIVRIVIGFLLLLCIYVLLKTINPDLLNLVPDFSGALSQIQTNSPVNPTSKPTDEQQAVVVTPTNTGYATDPRTNISQYDQLISASADPKGIDCTLMKAGMYIESGGRSNLTSSMGARGLMQVMPAVAQTFHVSVDSLFDPQTNIETSSKLWLYNYRSGCNGAASNTVCNTNDSQYVIAAYSAGAGANKASVTCSGQTIWQCTANAGYQETRDYIPKVRSAYNTLKQNGWGCN